MITRCSNAPVALLAVLLIAVWPPFAFADADPLPAEELIAAGDYQAAARQLDRALGENPDDLRARFQRARLRGFTGEYEAALKDYEALLDRFPNNVDYVFGRAQVLAWTGRDAEALAELERASAMAPRYEAVWRLRHAVQQRQRGDAAAVRLAELRRAAAERFPEAGWWRDAVDTAPADETVAWTLLAGGSVEALSGSRPGWDDQFVTLQWRRSASATYSLKAARASRFAGEDLTAAFGGEWRLSADWSAGVELAAAADAEFLPQRAVIAHVGRRLGEGWNVDLRYNRRDFASATVTSYNTRVAYYFGAFRAAYTLGIAHLHGAANSIGHVAAFNWYRNDRHSFGVSVATGEEAEVITPGEVLETDVAGFSVTGRHRLTDRLGVDWWLGTHEQGDFYRRRYAGLAVSVGF